MYAAAYRQLLERRAGKERVRRHCLYAPRNVHSLKRAAAGEHTFSHAVNALRYARRGHVSCAGKGAVFYLFDPVGKVGAFKAYAAVKSIGPYFFKPVREVHALKIFAAGKSSFAYIGNASAQLHPANVIAAEKRPAGKALEACRKRNGLKRAAACKHAVFYYLNTVLKLRDGKPSAALEAVPAYTAHAGRNAYLRQCRAVGKRPPADIAHTLRNAHAAQQHALVESVGRYRDRALRYIRLADIAPRLEQAFSQEKKIVLPLHFVFVIVFIKRRSCENILADVFYAFGRMHALKPRAPLKRLVFNAL